MITPKLTVNGITSLPELHAHLETALQLEHATIPPYFTAWLTASETENPAAVQIIRSVLVEEMLHLTLVANILNAVGGKPKLTREGFSPNYPAALPHSGRKFLVSIERFSREALDTFMRIELPEDADAEPEPDEYRTIGQFYSAIADGIRYLADSIGESKLFVGRPELQIGSEDYYASGNLFIVEDSRSALKAIEEIKEQGEGTASSPFDLDKVILGDGPGSEPAHYFRFKELQSGRRYAAGDTLRTGPTGPMIEVNFQSSYPMVKNPKLSDYPTGSAIRQALEDFIASYGLLLACLEAGLNGERARMREAMARMFSLKNQALALVRTPTSPGADTTVGLVFGRN